MIISKCFFHFFKILIFRVVRVGWGMGGGQKWSKMTKNSVCRAPYLLLEPHIIWLSFAVHKCKMTISPGIFLIFFKYRFFGLLGGSKSKGKKWSRMTLSVVPLYHTSYIIIYGKRIISAVFAQNVCGTPYLVKYTSYDRDFWYTFVKWWHL